MCHHHQQLRVPGPRGCLHESSPPKVPPYELSDRKYSMNQGQLLPAAISVGVRKAPATPRVTTGSSLCAKKDCRDCQFVVIVLACLTSLFDMSMKKKNRIKFWCELSRNLFKFDLFTKLTCGAIALSQRVAQPTKPRNRKVDVVSPCVSAKHRMSQSCLFAALSTVLIFYACWVWNKRKSSSKKASK